MDLLMVLSVVVALGYGWYVVLILRRNKAREALSGIDVQLRRRHDLIPNILKIAQRFMEHEQALLTEVTKLRSQAMDLCNTSDVAARFNVEQSLSGALGRLQVQMEAYPMLKSDQPMLQSMQTFNEVEENISAARRFYNAAVNSLNNAVHIFPGSIIASLAKVAEMPLYEAEQAAKAPIDADQFLRR